ncbi:MAG TPA: AAA family ATPase, partial [Pyrinomonadaceae bacterium]|nr:AAA family ATPase [Pyrinomonadaceae bacterium]
MLRTLAVANYRSLRNLIVPLQRLNLITGPNGSGKSSVYRALRLLADTAQGGVIPSLAREGGLQSTLWAGPENLGRGVKRGEHKVEGTVRKERTNLRLGFAGDEFGYAIDLGLPAPSRSAFALDPEIKTETIWAGPLLRPAALLVERHTNVVRSRNSEGDWDVLAYELSSFDSMLTQFADPRNAPEMLRLREQIRSWRFYDHFRTDVDAPARLPQIGTHTPVLSNDGSDMAAALQTILEVGDREALAEAVDDAFPRSSIEVLNLD